MSYANVSCTCISLFKEIASEDHQVQTYIISQFWKLKACFQPLTVDIPGEIDTITETSEAASDKKDKKKDLYKEEEKGDNKSEDVKEDNSVSETADDQKSSTAGSSSESSISDRLCHHLILQTVTFSLRRSAFSHFLSKHWCEHTFTGVILLLPMITYIFTFFTLLHRLQLAWSIAWFLCAVPV